MKTRDEIITISVHVVDNTRLRVVFLENNKPYYATSLITTVLLVENNAKELKKQLNYCNP